MTASSPHAWRSRIAVVALAAALSPSPAPATTLVPMRTGDLVAASVGAVRGRVVRIATGLDPTTGAIATYVTLAVEEVLYGPFSRGELTLRELGGQLGGRRMWAFGNPEYRAGESVLVFVSPHPDGALHTTGLAMGKYRIEDAFGGPRARRDFGRSVVALAADSGRRVPVPKDDLPLATLRAQIVARAARAQGAPPGLDAHAERRAVRLEPRTSFLFLNPASRWFEPDAGQFIGYLVDPFGDAALGSLISRQAVGLGLSTWSALPVSPLDLRDVGDAQPSPFAGCPDATRILFNDPFGELQNPTNCRGILAIGGACEASAETRTVNGKTFLRILSGKVTFNDGWGDCAQWTACNLAEIATHEIGHTLGLGHSDVAGATMAQAAHFDGRCAALTADDEAAIAFAYPFPPSPTATPTVTPTPAATATVTQTGTHTRTPSRTATPSITRTPTRTATRSHTPLRTRTATPSRTRTPTRTATPTRSGTATATPAASATATVSPTPTATRSPSATATTTPAAPGPWPEVVRAALRQLLATPTTPAP